METQKKASVEELAEAYVLTGNTAIKSHQQSFIAGYNECEKTLIVTQQLNESIMQTNTAMGKRLLAYEQALNTILISDTLTEAKQHCVNALKLPCDFPIPYSEAEVIDMLKSLRAEIGTMVGDFNEVIKIASLDPTDYLKNKI